VGEKEEEVLGTSGKDSPTALTRRGGRNSKRGDAGGGALGRTGSIILATFQWSSGDEDSRRTCYTTRRRSWRGQLASAMLLCVESGANIGGGLSLGWPTATTCRGKARRSRAQGPLVALFIGVRVRALAWHARRGVAVVPRTLLCTA
jgi:hypothetical protein